MDGCFGSDIVQLAELLRSSNENDSDFEDEQRVKQQSNVSSRKDTARPKIIVRKEVTDDDDDADDWRKCPNWHLVYKQAVTPADIYLQMSGKTQLTSSCEDMLITVELPGETGPGIDVKVTEDHLEVVASNFRLSTPLPHPVDPKLGSAKWDAAGEKLALTLRMTREFDYLNF